MHPSRLKCTSMVGIENAREPSRERKFRSAVKLNVLAMGLNPSPLGETFRFFVLLEHGDGEVPNEFAYSL